MAKDAAQLPAGTRRGFSVEQVAATGRLGRSRNAIYNLIAARKLKSYLVGRSRIIDEQAIDDCVALLEKEAQGEPINSEVSKQKARAGRAGRASQLEAT
jgi:hypothetical protein